MASVEKRNKAWRLVAFLGTGEDGKKIRSYKSIPIDGTTKHEAQKLANQFEAEAIKNKTVNDKNMTFSQFAEYWEKNTPNDSVTTKDRNRQLLSRILPAIGHIRLKKLTPQHILSLLRQLEKPNKRLDDKAGTLSSRTVQMHYKLISSMLGKAVKWRILPENVCTSVDTPKAISKKIFIYEEEDLVKFLRALFSKAPLKYQVFFTLALTSGLRRSEILGLRWSDINFEKSFLRVNQAAVRAVGKGIVYKEPKTDSSEAPVGIAKIALQLLKKLRVEQNKLKEIAVQKKRWHETDAGIIFTTATGTPMMPSTFGHWLIKFTESNNLPKIGVHAFRHMAASYALDRGFDLKYVSEFVRHSQISTTGDIYAHPLSNKMKQLSESLNSFVENAITPEENIEQKISESDKTIH